MIRINLLPGARRQARGASGGNVQAWLIAYGVAAVRRQLEAVVNDLTRARYGPTAVLMELSRILSAGGGPTVDPERLEEIRQQNPLAVYNATWDPHRLWLTELEEEDRTCTIKGIGKTNEDVAEFLRRLTLSERFEQIELVKTQGTEDPATRLPVISFHLTARVIY